MRRTNRRIVACALLAFAVLLPACSGKEAIVDPEPQPLPPLLPESVSVEDNVVSWTTDVASRGSVRYGFTANDLDHMAYPASKDRADRALTQSHRVPLLDVRAGQTIYIQTVNEAPGHPMVLSEVGHFQATTTPTIPLLTSTMIHIGFGDCHLITMPGGARLLIDGGERAAEGAVRSYMQRHGVTSVRAMLATHVHIDHLGSFVADVNSRDDGMLFELRPGVFFDSPVKSADRFAYAEALETVERAGIRRVVLSRGQTSANAEELALDANVDVVVLSSGTPPDIPPLGGDQENTDINNDSIVLKFTYGDVDFIIGGDAEDGAEISMLRAFPREELDVEYYKAHHHGLPDASSIGWVRALLPRVAFVPNTDLVWDGDLSGALSETVTKLHEIGAHVYAIDDATSLGRPRQPDDVGVQYNVTFATDGSSYEVRLEPAQQDVPLRKVTTDTACGSASRVPYRSQSTEFLEER